MSEKLTEAGRNNLRELCDKATPGDWWIDSHGRQLVAHNPFSSIFITHGEAMGPATRHPETGYLSHWPNDWDASYIVAVQPKVVRGLLDEIERLQADNQELKSAKHTIECRFEVSEDTLSCIRGCLRAAEGDIDQLKAENQRWRQNYEHLIEQHMPRTGHGCEEGWSRVVEARELSANNAELLDALKDALCALECSPVQYEHIMGKARRAIAKAMGEK